jgi:hypothetical protein
MYKTSNIKIIPSQVFQPVMNQVTNTTITIKVTLRHPKQTQSTSHFHQIITSARPLSSQGHHLKSIDQFWSRGSSSRWGVFKHNEIKGRKVYHGKYIERNRKPWVQSPKLPKPNETNDRVVAALMRKHC